MCTHACVHVHVRACTCVHMGVWVCAGVHVDVHVDVRACTRVCVSAGAGVSADSGAGVCKCKCECVPKVCWSECRKACWRRSMPLHRQDASANHRQLVVNSQHVVTVLIVLHALFTVLHQKDAWHAWYNTFTHIFLCPSMIGTLLLQCRFTTSSRGGHHHDHQ